MSFSVAVLAREGRGGGDVPVFAPLDLFIAGTESVICALAAKGSCSGTRAVAVEVTEDRLCFRARGFGFWSELRTRGGVGLELTGGASVGVFERTDVGGGGACLEGTNGVYLAASAAWRLDSARRALYSWMDSLEGL